MSHRFTLPLSASLSNQVLEAGSVLFWSFSLFLLFLSVSLSLSFSFSLALYLWRSLLISDRVAMANPLEAFRQQWQRELNPAKTPSTASTPKSPATTLAAPFRPFSANTSGSPSASASASADTDTTAPPQPPSSRAARPQDALLAALIQDWDSLDAEPHFDACLPSEVAELVFRYLDLPSLGRCAAVSTRWAALLDNADAVWRRHALQAGVPAETRVQQGNWRNVVRDQLLRRRATQTRWRELQATFTQFHRRQHDDSDDDEYVEEEFERGHAQARNAHGRRLAAAPAADRVERGERPERGDEADAAEGNGAAQTAPHDLEAAAVSDDAHGGGAAHAGIVARQRARAWARERARVQPPGRARVRRRARIGDGERVLTTAALSGGTAVAGYAAADVVRLFGTTVGERGCVLRRPGRQGGRTTAVGRVGDLVAAGDSEGRLTLWDAANRAFCVTLDGPAPGLPVTDICLPSSGRAVAVAHAYELSWFVAGTEAAAASGNHGTATAAKRSKITKPAPLPERADAGVPRTWHLAWRLSFSRPLDSVVALDSSRLACLSDGAVVEVVDAVRGVRVARLHGPLEAAAEAGDGNEPNGGNAEHVVAGRGGGRGGANGNNNNNADGNIGVGLGITEQHALRDRCWGLVCSGPHLAYAASSPLRHTVRVHDAASGALRCVLDHAGRPATALAFTPDARELVAGGRRTGVRVYSLQTERVVQHIPRANYDIQCLQVDDWRVVVGARDLDMAGHVVALFDRSAATVLWHVRSVEPVRSVSFADAALLYSSRGPACRVNAQDRPVDESLEPGVLDGLDFEAPLAALASASCPFSSLYEDVQGYNYNIVLETIYDNIVPNRLG